MRNMVESKVYRNSAIYTFCNFLTKALNFVLLPLYTAYLSTADYGVTGILDNFKGVMGFVAIFSLQAAVMRFYVDYRDKPQMLARYAGTLFLFSLLSSVAWSLLIVVLRPVLMPLLFKGIDFYPTLLVALVGLVFSNVYTIYQQLLRGMEAARLSALTSVSLVLLTAVFTITFVTRFRMGANGVLLAQAIACFLLCVTAILHLRHVGMFYFCIDRTILRECLLYSVPLMPHNLSTNIAALVSSVLINGSGSLSDVGIYNLASKFGVVCDIFQNSVNTAYQPWLFRVLHDKVEGFKDQIVSFTETLLWVYAAVFVAVGLFIQELILLFLADGYGDAWSLVPLIVGVYSIKTVYYFYIGVLFYYKRATRFIFIATVSSSILNVLLSAILIPLYSSYGSVTADAIAMVLRVSLIVWMSRRYEDVGYRIWQFVRPTIGVLIALAVGLFFSYTKYPYELSIPNFLWKCLVYLVFLTMICLTHRSAALSVCNTLMRRVTKREGCR